jgi:hypothetical protein
MGPDQALRVAPSRHGGHWTAKNWADLDFATEEDWQTAIDIFEDRIHFRFLDAIEKIQRMRFSGFAVMALDCLLIETLQQFRRGVAETPPRESGDYFTEFLTQTGFGQFFDEEMAGTFYRSIRCGVLHQAEVKGSSKIWIRRGSPLVRWADDQDGLVVNRDLFHRQLERVFDAYVRDLRKSRQLYTELRERFKRKMDFVCRVGGGAVE